MTPTNLPPDLAAIQGRSEAQARGEGGNSLRQVRHDVIALLAAVEALTKERDRLVMERDSASNRLEALRLRWGFDFEKAIEFYVDAREQSVRDLTAERDRLARENDALISVAHDHQSDREALDRLRAQVLGVKASYDALIAEERRVFGGPISHGGRAGSEMNAFRDAAERLFEAEAAAPDKER